MDQAETVTKRASHQNIFIEKNGLNLTQLIEKISSSLKDFDLTAQVSKALEKILLPPLDVQGLPSTESVAETLEEMVKSTDKGAKMAEDGVGVVGFFFILSVLVDILAVLSAASLIWDVCKPGK